MELNNTFSLSLQKQISNQQIVIDSEINNAFKELKFRSSLNRSGIRKTRGYKTITLLFLIVLLPFIKRKLTDLWNSEYLRHSTNAQKDVFYRFLSYERFNWRKFVYLLALNPDYAVDTFYGLKNLASTLVSRFCFSTYL